jgi:hypothetical protein
VERAVELDADVTTGAISHDHGEGHVDVSNDKESLSARAIGGAVEFIRALESILFYFIETGFAVPSSAVPEALKIWLLAPVEVFTETYQQPPEGVSLY